MSTRADIVRIARSYIGTPFHHMERQPGLGIDCAGVLICAARDASLVEKMFDVPAYEPVPDGRVMLKWCREHMVEVSKEAMRPGDAILLITDEHPQHLGILGDYLHGGLSIIHASNVAVPPRVIETRLMFSRTMRFVAAFSFPGVEG